MNSDGRTQIKHDDVHAFYVLEERREQRRGLVKFILITLFLAGGLAALCWPIWKAM